MVSQKYTHISALIMLSPESFSLEIAHGEFLFVWILYVPHPIPAFVKTLIPEWPISLFQTLTFQLSHCLRSQGKKSSPPPFSNTVRAESLPDTRCYTLPPSAPPLPYTPSPAATLCCPWCFIISLGVCGPPLLSFDGVQTVKARRQPANFPCCDSPTARGRAIFPLHQSLAYIPLMRKLSALLSTIAYLNCPPFCLFDYFVWGLVTGLISTVWGRGCNSGLCCAAAGGHQSALICSLTQLLRLWKIVIPLHDCQALLFILN